MRRLQTLDVHLCCISSTLLQAKEKKGLSKYDENKGVRRGTADDTPLDDPVSLAVEAIELQQLPL